MRIRKTSQYIEGGASLSNVYGTSDSNGYTQEYINNNVGVVESGSNANGSYVKYADGTMICYDNRFFNMNITSEFEGIYYANTGEISFAQSFIATPTINVTLRGVAGGGYSFYTPSATGFTGFVWKIQSKSNVDLYVMYFAIGKWK